MSVLSDEEVLIILFISRILRAVSFILKFGRNLRLSESITEDKSFS